MDFSDKAFTDPKNYIMKFYDKGEIKETMLWARKKNEEDLAWKNLYHWKK